MPRLTFSGFDDIAALLDGERERVKRNGEAALMAGAEVARNAMMDSAPLRKEARNAGHKKHLRDSVKIGKVNYSHTEGYTTDVGPSGKRDDGQEFAKIGAILEYGKSSMAAHPWMVPAMEQHGGEIAEAMRKELFKD